MMKLCSAIMPTRGRPELAAKALQCFLSQDYPHKTLVIIDDKEERSFPESVTHPLVRYELSPERCIPVKRNMAANMASDGSIVVHFDSDDYSAPDRMADQVYRLEESGKQVTGYHSLLFHEELSGRTAKYIPHTTDYGLGTSLCFTKTWWESHPFNEAKRIAEDNEFVKVAVKEGQFIGVDAGQLMVARVHSANTSAKDLNKMEYRAVDKSALPEAFFL